MEGERPEKKTQAKWKPNELQTRRNSARRQHRQSPAVTSRPGFSASLGGSVLEPRSALRTSLRHHPAGLPYALEY